MAMGRGRQLFSCREARDPCAPRAVRIGRTVGMTRIRGWLLNEQDRPRLEAIGEARARRCRGTERRQDLIDEIQRLREGKQSLLRHQIGQRMNCFLVGHNDTHQVAAGQ
jgi:hypothetical protein